MPAPIGPKSLITLPNTETRSTTSRKNNVTYKLFVSLPEGYQIKGNHSYQEHESIET